MYYKNDTETKENELNKTGKNIYSPRECVIEDMSFMRYALLWKQKIHKKVLQERRQESSQVLVKETMTTRSYWPFPQ